MGETMIKYPNRFWGLTVLLAAGSLMAQEPRSAGFYYSRADSVARLYLKDPHLTMIRSDSVDILAGR